MEIMKLNLLEKSILATIAYYDVLEYPLTGFEIFKYLINPSHIIAQSDLKRDLTLEPLIQPVFMDVLKSLNNKSLTDFIEEKNGFYCLKKSKKSGEKYIDKLIEIRIERQKISDQKWKKAKKIIRKLQAVPYVKIIAVSGSLALDNAKKQSDIDLLIITKHKRIWTVRFFITFLTQIMGKRRHGKKTADRICLNHYITDKSLKIDFPSLYNAQTYAHLIPVLEKGIYNEFQKANQWIKNYLAFYPKQENFNQRVIKQSKFLKTIARFQETILNTFLGSILEKILSFFQKAIIRYHSSSAKKQGRVIADEFQLEFHPASPEVKILERYNKNMLKLEFKIKPEKDSGLLIINQ